MFSKLPQTLSAQATLQQEGWRNNFRNDTSLIGPRPNSWWTGKPPIVGVCPGVNAKGIIRSLKLPNLQTCTRQEASDYFDNIWTATEVLFSALQGEEAFFRPPYHQIRHSLIFYYCHPAVFYINKFKLAGIITESIDTAFEKLFEVGVDEMSWDDLSKNEGLWPAVHEVTAYRAKVYQLVKKIISEHDEFNHLPITSHSALWSLFMGFEHERIHFETSSVLMRELPIHLVQKPKQWPEYYPPVISKHEPQPSIDYPVNAWLEVSLATVKQGKPENWPSFGWDNEYGELTSEVKSFFASQFLISNGEFWEFVISGGYQQQHYWSDEGWNWCCFRNTTYPTFWIPTTENSTKDFKLRICFAIIPMQWSWPVIVNFHEVKAYCAWRSEKDKMTIPYRVMTEKEHCCLRDTVPYDPIMALTGEEMLAQKININMAFGSESPVNFSTPSQSGFYDVFGNVWEWCEDYFAPLPGFKAHYLYSDFSMPCFDNEHNIIMGGSFISTGDEASCWARYSFRRHFFQHAGFRLVHPKEKT